MDEAVRCSGSQSWSNCRTDGHRWNSRSARGLFSPHLTTGFVCVAACF